MGYIGAAPQFGHIAKQVLTPNSSTTTWALDYPVPTANALIVSYGGVIQEPGVAFTTDGTNITFTFTPTTGTLLYLQFLGQSLTMPEPAAESVTEAKLDAAVGAPILIASATASNSATIDFDSGIDWTAYDRYVVYCQYFVPATDDSYVLIRTSTDNGVSYDASAGDYEYTNSRHHSSGTTTTVTSSTSATAMHFGEISAGASWGSATSESVSFVLTLHNPSQTGLWSHIEAIGLGWRAAGDFSRMNMAGSRQTLADIDGIRFLCDSGNIESGTFKLYGMR